MKAGPLGILLRQDRNAMTVYSSLRWMAGDGRQLGTTRARIREVCHHSDKVITSAMNALDAAGWIKRSYGRSGNVTWYRISFPKTDFFPVGRKTTPREKRGGSKNGPQGSRRCGSKNDPHVLTDIGRNSNALNGTSESAPRYEEHPSVRIERERLRIARGSA